MDEGYDEALEKFLNSDSNTLYVKAENIDIRVHLIGLFAGMVNEMGAEPTIDELRKIEQFIKYG